MELHLFALLVAVGVAAMFDVREHRIPNWLVASGIVIAIAYHATARTGNGAGFALSGFGLGLIALMPLYAMRTMGAGDVKLMGMVGTFLGPSEAFSAILATLIAGGVLALLVTVRKRALGRLLSNLHTMIIQRHIRQMGGAVAGETQLPESVGKLPYAVAIAVGTVCQIFWLRGA